jgi:hypothetical protein
MERDDFKWAPFAGSSLKLKDLMEQPVIRLEA